MNDGWLPPSNAWVPSEPCVAPDTSPSIVAGITITGVPAMIAGAGGGYYVWSITLNDGGGPPNFTIDHYDGTGTLIDHPMAISGVDGSITFNDPVYLSRDPLLPMEAATKEYVDANSLTGQDVPAGLGVCGRQNIGGNGSWTPLAPPALGYLPLGGGYLTGAIGFNGPVTQRLIGGVTPSPGNLWRWGLSLGDNSPESGSNTGSNFVVTSYNDAGSGATAQLTIDRQGNTTFSNSCVFPSQVIVNGRMTLGSPSSLQIGAGATGQMLATDGFGNLSWQTPPGAGTISEAPQNGSTYGRNNAAWVVVPPQAISSDAPAISQMYGRYNNGWVQVGQQFLALAGGSMTGPLIFNAAGGARAIAGQASGAMRWAEYIGDATAESGGNSGSNFSLVRYSDAGAIIDTPLSISRASGLATFADGVSVPTPAPTDSSNLAANTAWVQAAIASGANITVGDTPPATPSNGSLWFDSVGAQLYLYYTDPTSSQWVPVVNQQGAYLPIVGGTLTGPLTAPSANFTNNATAPDPPLGAHSQNLATTNWVQNTITAYPLGDNRIINGNFAINQRGYVSGAALAAAAYGHDRWKAGAAGCTYTFTAALPDTTVSITAGTLTQVIEAGMIEGGIYTLSWSGTAQARVYQGTPTGVYVSSPLNTASLPAGVNTIVEFSTGTVVRAKLEIGNTATPFNRQTMAKSLADCQRYFMQWGPGLVGQGSWSSPTIGTCAAIYPTMRASPTVTMGVNTGFSYGGGAATWNTVNVSPQFASIGLTTTGGTIGLPANLIVSAGNFLAFSAEL